MTVASLFDKLGRKRITAQAGHGQQVLSRAVVENIMPAGWYPGIKAMCDHDGIPCPTHLFRWERKKPARRPTLDAGAA